MSQKRPTREEDDKEEVADVFLHSWNGGWHRAKFSRRLTEDTQHSTLLILVGRLLRTGFCTSLARSRSDNAVRGSWTDFVGMSNIPGDTTGPRRMRAAAGGEEEAVKQVVVAALATDYIV